MTEQDVQVKNLTELLNENSQGSLPFRTNDKNGDIRTVIFKPVTYTPELAKYILENHNSNNRDIRRNNVEHILSEILGGNWMFNGETIGFDENNQLTNGQHRLTSVVESGESLLIPTFTNLNPEAFKTIDTGSVRTAVDVLSIEGVNNSDIMASTIKFINDMVKNTFNNNGKGRKHNLSNTDVIDYYAQLNPMILQESIDFSTETKTKSPILTPQKFVTGFHYIFKTINPDKGEEFMNKLITGTNITDGCPIKLLREKLFTDKTSNKKKDKLTPAEKVKYIIYTWNKYVEGAQVNRLVLNKNYKPTLDVSLIPTLPENGQ